VDNYNSSVDLPSTPKSINKIQPCINSYSSQYLDNERHLVTGSTKPHHNSIFGNSGLVHNKPRNNYQPSLIDDSRASRRIRDNNYYDERTINTSQQKPYVGITAATRFRRAHTLDMIRSTKMPLNSNNNCANIKSPKSNEPSAVNFNKVQTNNATLFHNSSQFNNPKLVARF